jgi:hypothetical protein
MCDDKQLHFASIGKQVLQLVARLIPYMALQPAIVETAVNCRYADHSAATFNNFGYLASTTVAC